MKNISFSGKGGGGGWVVGGLRAAPAQISVSIDFRGKVYIGVRIFLLSAPGGGRGGWCGRGCCALVLQKVASEGS